jgi:AraC-like DNA-binding protein
MPPVISVMMLHYLKDANLSISRIAWLLGFQEVSAFTHAFKRWTGQKPTRMRSQNRAGCVLPNEGRRMPSS